MYGVPAGIDAAGFAADVELAGLAEAAGFDAVLLDAEAGAFPPR